VAWSMRYFPEGRFTAEAFATAEVAAQAVMDEAVSSCRREDWDTAYGSSGTVGAVADALQAAGWPAGRISSEALSWLLDRLLKAGSAEHLRMDGVKDDRRAVIGGGVAILRAIFALLDIDEMHVAQGALRHGALVDLMNREDAQTDQRSASVTRLARNFHADPGQIRRVAQVAEQILRQLTAHTPWPELDLHVRQVTWAAQLHEIGRTISHSDYHKHGAYILDNADASGFTMNELHRLSQLVLGHRGKLRKLDLALDDTDFTLQLMALRLAVVCCHARRDPDLTGLQFAWEQPRTICVSVPAHWAQQFPQSSYQLKEEAQAWQKTAWALSVL